MRSLTKQEINQFVAIEPYFNEGWMIFCKFNMKSETVYLCHDLFWRIYVDTSLYKILWPTRKDAEDALRAAKLLSKVFVDIEL